MLNLRSAREINRMRPACELVAEAHRRVAAQIRPGVTTAELDQVVDQLFTEAGAIALFKGVPGAVPFPAATCTSVNEQVVHGIPGPRILREGDIVSIDTGCKLDGWCGDSAWTYPVGTVDDSASRLLEVTRRTLELAIDLLAKKPRWSDIAREMQDFVEAAGMSVVDQFVGHGIGKEMHEPPQVPNFDSLPFRRSGDFPIRTGLVLAIEPMVNLGKKEVVCLKDHWTQVTADGRWSAHFEHTVALTSDGPLALTKV